MLRLDGNADAEEASATHHHHPTTGSDDDAAVTLRRGEGGVFELTVGGALMYSRKNGDGID